MKSKKLLITILALSASILVAIIVYFTPFEKEEIILSESTTTKEIQTTKSDVYEYKEGFTSEPLPAPRRQLGHMRSTSAEMFPQEQR